MCNAKYKNELENFDKHSKAIKVKNKDILVTYVKLKI